MSDHIDRPFCLKMLLANRPMGLTQFSHLLLKETGNDNYTVVIKNFVLHNSKRISNNTKTFYF